MQQQTSHNRQKKLAVINDFCGFGRCSIAVALPIISAMHIQCCPLPTAIFSDHTGFESFFCEDFTEHMPAYSREWEKLGLTFDGAATGFLGSARQIDIVKEFLTRFKTKRTKVLVDPVMGDYGKLYPTYTQELAGRMHELLRFADLLLQAIKCRLQDLLLPPGIAPSQPQKKICKYLHIFRKQWAAFFFFMQSILPGFSQRLLGCQSFGAFLQNICKPAGFL